MASFVPSAFAQETGNWQLFLHGNESGKEQKAVAKLISGDGSTLKVTCEDVAAQRIAIRFLTKRNIGSSDNLVIVRFGTAPQFRATQWTYHNREATIQERGYVEAFMNALESGEQEIRVRALNFSNQPIDALFVSKNGAEAINKIKESCGKSAI